jgi:hypothetical protein
MIFDGANRSGEICGLPVAAILSGGLFWTYSQFVAKR